MTKKQLENALAECTVEALEQMFFVRALEGTPSDGAEADSDLICRVDFAGETSGCLALRITVEAARSIAAGFLGEDDGALSEVQVGEVLCELTNIVCGSLLSRIESGTTFRLDSPQIAAPENSASGEAVVHSVGLDNGVLTARFATERPICPMVA
jgi:CheY-specific phosphatase CheX